MANFRPAIEKILKKEGGYSNHENDRGKETYLGISRKWHPHWEGWPIIDRHKKILLGDIPFSHRFKDEHLMQLVHRFYHKNYWMDIKGEQIPDQKLAESLLDTVIMHGVAGKRMIQKALVRLGQDLTVDGRFGPNTLKAILAVDPLELNTAVKRMRLAHIDRLVKSDKSQKTFAKGWKERVAPELAAAY